MRFVLLIAASVLPLGTSLAQAKAGATSTGVCSYYARSHDGHITAGHQKFDSNALTAAHRTYRMGTKLKLTNLANGRSVIVTVNDRGPFVKGREISVTRRAARELGFIKQGLAKVSIEQVE